MASLANFTVLVTGGAAGLGKAIATTFLESGANAAICDVSPERLASVSSEWEGTYAGRFLTVQTDVTDESAVTSFVAAAVEKFGKVDMLVNNAGIMDRFEPASECDMSMWDKVMAVNVTGTFLATKAAVNAMLSSGGGTIINISSVAGYRGGAAGAAYTASKHAVVGLSRNTAGFYGPKGIYSIVLYLGGMEETNIYASFGVNPPKAENMARQRELVPGYVMGETGVKIAHVAKYCTFFADRDLAASSNGGEVKINKNWPSA